MAATGGGGEGEGEGNVSRVAPRGRECTDNASGVDDEPFEAETEKAESIVREVAIRRCTR